MNAACGIKSGGVAPTCKMCVSPQTCNSHACGVAPASTWDLVILTGTVPAEPSPGTTWDGAFFSYPDPYVFAELDYGGANYTRGFTTSMEDTVSPDWGAKVIFSKVRADLLLKSNNWIEVLDDDGVDIASMLPPDTSGDQTMGYCPLTLTQAMFNGVQQQKLCSPSSTGLTWKVNFKLVAHP